MNKLAIISFIAALMLLYPHQGFTLSANAIEIGVVERAQSADDLSRQLARVSQLKIFETACKAQLRTHHLPYSCYDAQILRKSNRWPTDEALFAGLNIKCETIARSIKDIKIKRPNKLPADCLGIAERQIRINRYKIGKDFD